MMHLCQLPSQCASTTPNPTKELTLAAAGAAAGATAAPAAAPAPSPPRPPPALPSDFDWGCVCGVCHQCRRLGRSGCAGARRLAVDSPEVRRHGLLAEAVYICLRSGGQSPLNWIDVRSIAVCPLDRSRSGELTRSMTPLTQSISIPFMRVRVRLLLHQGKISIRASQC